MKPRMAIHLLRKCKSKKRLEALNLARMQKNHL
jgi:hypothetical protein